MSRTATILLVLVAAGLVVLVATTQRWRFSIDRTIQPGTALFDFDPADIRHISIKNGDQSFRLLPGDDGWIIESATRDTASPEAVAALFQIALETPVLDRIDSSEIQTKEKLADYGVQKSSVQLDFKGDRPIALLFGKSGAGGNRTYVAFENSKTIYLIPDNLTRLVTQAPEAFRDTRLADFDPDRVRRIEIRRGLSNLELENKGRGWRIVKPLETAADDEQVRALLETWRTATISSFEIPTTAPETAPGTVESDSEIRIFREDSPAPITIALGEKLPDGLIVAKIQPRNITAAIPAAIEKSTAIDLDQIRDRAIARPNPDLVDLIRLQSPVGPREIRRATDGWSVPAENVVKLFRGLAETKAIRFIPATPTELAASGLDQPARRLEFLSVLSENTPEAAAGEHPVLILAIGTPQTDGTVPVHIEGTPEIAFVPAEFLKSLEIP